MKIKEQIKQEIQRLLNIDELHYGNLLMDKAYEYLNSIMRLDAWGIKILTSCPMFWKWWVNQWEHTDRIWYFDTKMEGRMYLTTQQQMDYRQSYDNMHAVELMVAYPNKLVMEETYAIMVGEIIDSKNAIHGVSTQDKTL